MSHNPLEFIDTISSGKHVVLFYDKLEDGLQIQFRFIKNGLLKGEHCIYTTFGDTNVIEAEMKHHEIDVEGFKQKNLLHIYQITNAMDDPGGAVIGGQKILSRILANVEPPYRVVTRLIPDIATTDKVEACDAIERDVHVGFSNFKGSMICPYHTEQIEPSRHDELIGSVLKNHHAAIFAPRSGKGMAFEIT